MLMGQGVDTRGVGALWSEFFARLPRPVLVLDRGGRLQYANRFAERLLFGGDTTPIGAWYGDEALFGKQRRDAVHPVAEVLSTGKAVIGAEIDIMTAREGRLHLLVTAVPLHDTMGDLCGVGLLLEDRTEEAATREEGEWLRGELAGSRDRIERLLARSEVLNEIGEAVSSGDGIDQVLQRAIDRTASAVRADFAALEVEDAGLWAPMVATGVPLSGSGEVRGGLDAEPAAIAAATRMPFAVSDVAEEELLSPDAPAGAGSRALLCVPVQTGQGDPVRAVLSLQRAGGCPFDAEETAFVSRVATTVGLAMENSRVHAEEHHIAETLQRALLSVPRRVRGLEFEYIYRSATEAAMVGGDFFDLFELPGARVGVLMGDVSGKGIEASALASFTRQLILAEAQDAVSPAEAVSRTNELVFRGSQIEDYVTLVFCVVNLADYSITYCNAGHPPPMVTGNGRLECLTGGGPIVGAWSGPAFEDRTATLGPSDTLVLYTDGVIEAKREQQLFGQQRMLSLVRAIADRPLDQVPSEIVARVSEYSRGRLRDDIAVLCVRRGAS